MYVLVLKFADFPFLKREIIAPTNELTVLINLFHGNVKRRPLLNETFHCFQEYYALCISVNTFVSGREEDIKGG